MPSKDSKNPTLQTPDIPPLMPDALSIVANLIEATKSQVPTKSERTYRYVSGTLTGANIVTFTMQNAPDFWVIVFWGSGANTDFSVYEEGNPPYLGTSVTGKQKVVIPANSRSVNITKTGNDVRYIMAGIVGYNPTDIL